MHGPGCGPYSRLKAMAREFVPPSQTLKQSSSCCATPCPTTSVILATPSTRLFSNIQPEAQMLQLRETCNGRGRQRRGMEPGQHQDSPHATDRARRRCSCQQVTTTAELLWGAFRRPPPILRSARRAQVGRVDGDARVGRWLARNAVKPQEYGAQQRCNDPSCRTR